MELYQFQLLCLLILLFAIPMALAYGELQSEKVIIIKTGLQDLCRQFPLKYLVLKETPKHIITSVIHLGQTSNLHFFAAKIEPLHIPVERLCMSGWLCIGSLAASVSLNAKLSSLMKTSISCSFFGEKIMCEKSGTNENTHSLITANTPFRQCFWKILIALGFDHFRVCWSTTTACSSNQQQRRRAWLFGCRFSGG